MSSKSSPISVRKWVLEVVRSGPGQSSLSDGKRGEERHNSSLLRFVFGKLRSPGCGSESVGSFASDWGNCLWELVSARINSMGGGFGDVCVSCMCGAGAGLWCGLAGVSKRLEKRGVGPDSI